MMRLYRDDILALHALLANETGGDAGVRDLGLVESAVESAYATFGGEYLYPTALERGARLGFSLIENHAFLDGNKRIGVLAMLTLLSLEGIFLEISDEELARVGLAVAAGEMGYDALLAWVRTHSGN